MYVYIYNIYVYICSVSNIKFTVYKTQGLQIYYQASSFFMLICLIRTLFTCKIRFLKHFLQPLFNTSDVTHIFSVTFIQPVVFWQNLQDFLENQGLYNCNTMRILVNPFQVNVLFSHPLKILGNLWFSVFSRDIEMENWLEMGSLI